MPHADPLLTASALLRPRLPRLFLAVALGVLSLCSALALAAVSAWLITRAWQMPPVLDLSVAVVTVRALAISRGVLHYFERLAGHDTALRATGNAREQIYRQLADGPAAVTTGLNSGELVARVGGDVDELAHVLVRSLVPIGVAGVLSIVATAVIAAISPAAAIILAACLLVAGVLAPWLSARAVAAEEDVARNHLAERDVAAVLALDHAPELRISGALPGVIAEAQRRQRAWGEATDAAARPAAVGAAMPTAAVGVSVLGALLAGITIAPTVAATTLAILMLLPLSAFEATTPLPAAAIQLTRSRIAARRLLDLAPPGQVPPRADTTAPAPLRQRTRHLSAVDVCAGYRSGWVRRLSVDLRPGARLAITGPSGSGKTTLLATLAGLIPALHGRLELDGTAVNQLPEDELRRAIGFFAEDAHIFATTVRDNLLVARGDCADEELTTALGRVGLGRWLAGLPEGLATVLPGGAQAVSAGQRRRLLLARAMISPARIVLLDEPTEHLDSADADTVLRALLSPDAGLFAADRTVVVATHQLPTEIRCPRLSTIDASTLATDEPDPAI
jgi:ATP-binding cassette subfamily C protein CydC